MPPTDIIELRALHAKVSTYTLANKDFFAMLDAIAPLLDELDAARRVVEMVREHGCGAMGDNTWIDGPEDSDLTEALAAYDAATKGGG